MELSIQVSVVETYSEAFTYDYTFMFARKFEISSSTILISCFEETSLNSKMLALFDFFTKRKVLISQLCNLLSLQIDSFFEYLSHFDSVDIAQQFICLLGKFHSQRFNFHQTFKRAFFD